VGVQGGRAFYIFSNFIIVYRRVMDFDCWIVECKMAYVNKRLNAVLSVLCCGKCNLTKQIMIAFPTEVLVSFH
jgi:hypothetical protein